MSSTHNEYRSNPFVPPKPAPNPDALRRHANGRVQDRSASEIFLEPGSAPPPSLAPEPLPHGAGQRDRPAAGGAALQGTRYKAVPKNTLVLDEAAPPPVEKPRIGVAARPKDNLKISAELDNEERERHRRDRERREMLAEKTRNPIHNINEKAEREQAEKLAVKR
jgi:hypothetical protein